MRKLFMRGLVLVSLFLVVGCNSNGKKEVSDSSESSSKTNLEITKKDYDSLVGTWECIEPDWTGNKVFISKTDSGLAIQYDGEDIVKTRYVSKSKNEDSTFYKFENIERETIYMIDLKENGYIVLNNGTTNPNMIGLSKPMEYRKISD